MISDPETVVLAISPTRLAFISSQASMATRTSPRAPVEPSTRDSRELRFETQRGSLRRARWHAVRMLVRYSVLLGVDGFVFLVARESFRWLRMAIPELALIIPEGLLGGAQAATALLIGLFVVGGYREGDQWRSWKRVWEGVALGTGLVLWGNLFSGAPRWTILQWALVAVPLSVMLAAARTGLSFLVAAHRWKIGRKEPVLIVAPEDDFESTKQSRLFDLAGPFEIKRALLMNGEASVSGFVGDVLASIQDVSTVVVSGYLRPEVWGRLVDLSDAGAFRLLSMAGHGGPTVTSVRHLSLRGIPVTEVTTPSLRYHQLVLKRLFDVLVASTLLVLLSPVFLLVAVAIKLSSPGPILFTQERVGLGGRRFGIIKFRSMQVDAEEHLNDLTKESVYTDGRLFKIQSDPRVTRLGAILRAWSLDELPQLLNVLRGEMSLDRKSVV